MSELRQRLASPSWLAPITLDPQRRLNALLGQWFDGAEGIQWTDLAATDKGTTDAVAAVARSVAESPGDAPQADQAVAVAPPTRSVLPSAEANHFPASRASNKGFLWTTLDEYLQLLDWTGRQLRPDKRGAIPSELPPILERLGIRGAAWLELVENFATWFHVAAGRVAQLVDEAPRLGRRWLHGRRRCAQAFP